MDQQQRLLIPWSLGNGTLEEYTILPSNLVENNGVTGANLLDAVETRKQDWFHTPRNGGWGRTPGWLHGSKMRSSESEIGEWGQWANVLMLHLQMRTTTQFNGTNFGTGYLTQTSSSHSGEKTLTGLGQPLKGFGLWTASTRLSKWSSGDQPLLLCVLHIRKTT